MVYSDIKKYGLLGILPKKKRYGTKKDKQIVREAVVANKNFLQFALQGVGATYVEKRIEKVVSFVITCNEAFYLD